MRIVFGKKQIEQATKWIGPLATFGAGGALAGLYMSDWKAVNRYIPFYGGKFPPEEPANE